MSLSFICESCCHTFQADELDEEHDFGCPNCGSHYIHRTGHPFPKAETKSEPTEPT